MGAKHAGKRQVKGMCAISREKSLPHAGTSHAKSERWGSSGAGQALAASNQAPAPGNGADSAPHPLTPLSGVAAVQRDSAPVCSVMDVYRCACPGGRRRSCRAQRPSPQRGAEPARAPSCRRSPGRGSGDPGLPCAGNLPPARVGLESGRPVRSPRSSRPPGDRLAPRCGARCVPQW